ncbi:MAG: helix-turn-helix domain-containing protein [Cyclobacteriaceae bacterium]
MSTKEVFNLEDLCTYTGFKKSTIHKLTSKCILPHYKPTNKSLFFKRTEIENWLLQNKQHSEQEIVNRAGAVMLARKGGAHV